MAKQTGEIRIVGTIGNITYYKSGGEYYVRQRSSVTRKQVMRDPRYSVARRNMAEFGTVALANKLLRTTFRTELSDIDCPHLANRLTKRLMEVVKSDDINEHGKRTMMYGDLDL